MSCGPTTENIIYPIRANICQNITDMSKVGTRQDGGLESHDMVAVQCCTQLKIKQMKILLQYSVSPPVYHILMRNQKTIYYLNTLSLSCVFFVNLSKHK